MEGYQGLIRPWGYLLGPQWGIKKKRQFSGYTEDQGEFASNGLVQLLPHDLSLSLVPNRKLIFKQFFRSWMI